MGGFIFASTLVISNVLYNSKTEITFPKWTITKELGFYFFSVLVIIVFGLIRKNGYPFIITFLSTYILYIFTTITIEKYYSKQKSEGDEKDLESSIDND